MDLLKEFALDSFESDIPKAISDAAASHLEDGKVIFLPNLAFSLNEEESLFLNPEIVDPKSKNISYDIRKGKLSGTNCSGLKAVKLEQMIHRYAQQTRAFMDAIFPFYKNHLIQARTSFRPVEAKGRIQSYKKDDTRLHVDAFPSAPTKGQRIIRFFTNVNPHGKPRVWRLGESFDEVVKKIAPKTTRPIPGFRLLLNLLNITKEYRTLYDHYMLQIHDKMKEDLNYQKTVPQQEILFPSGSSWITYSDQVSHAAMAGQHLFEQTFHLPVIGMEDSEKSPLKVLERYFGKALI
ncbi:MAG TPA: Kdo hydroxylase family protein [Parachlamydiaceae bacterium]|nr:Kdo hydroxylase family protein [Parachlamydiaceae bacterium]